MSDSRQHAESTTLQPCRTAAAVGNTIFVRVAWPRYAAAIVSEPVISHPTIAHVSAVLLLWVRVSIDECGNIGTFKNSNNLQTNQPILKQLRPQKQFFNEYFFSFFLAKIADDRQQQTTCGEQNTTTVVGPCARAVSSPCSGELLLS